MKKFSLFVLISLLVAVSGFAQDETNKYLYASKVKKYTNMKTTGLVLVAGGGLMMFGGIVMMSNADWDSQTDMYGNTNYSTSDAGGAAGIFMTILSVPVIGGGTVLAIIGNKKQKQYQKLLDSTTMNLNLVPQGAGLTLTYRF